ncbi:MAG: Gfo/Idh/MocA family protein [Promethearchaeota archaeon]
MKDKKIRVGVIGCGHWGPNHIRNFSSLPSSEVIMCCDLSDDRLKAMKEVYRSIQVTKNYLDIVENKNIDAVVVATPTSTHYKIVKDCLTYDKDVLCEKPLSIFFHESEELVKLAEVRGRILMVGHVFLFNSGIQWAKEYINNGDMGGIYYLHSQRTNLGPIRNDVNVIWDLASHDISIVSYLLNSYPKIATAKGESFLQDGKEDVAFISLTFPEKILVNIHVSWLDPQKVREITIVGDKKMVVWNDLSNIAPIRVYDKGVIRDAYYENFGEFQLMLRDGDILIPKINLIEPLKNQSNHFLDCIRMRKRPIADGAEGLNVVKVLNAIQESMEMNGQSIHIA